MLAGEKDYAGIVYARQPDVWMRFGPSLGRRVGLEIITPVGERLELRPVRRPADTLAQYDPDAYRAMRELGQVLSECGHPNAARVCACVRAAPFDPCPVCNDHYGLAEGCSACGGLGFVPEA